MILFMCQLLQIWSRKRRTDTAQAVCKVVLGSSEARCSGTIPEPSADDDGLGDDGAAPATDDTPSSSNICLPDNGCNVCDSCCASYLGDQDACDGCVAAECATTANVCASDAATCTTCGACCQSYLSDQDACDGCVASECDGKRMFALSGAAR